MTPNLPSSPPKQRQTKKARSSPSEASNSADSTVGESDTGDRAPQPGSDLEVIKSSILEIKAINSSILEVLQQIAKNTAKNVKCSADTAEKLGQMADVQRIDTLRNVADVNSNAPRVSMLFLEALHRAPHHNDLLDELEAKLQRDISHYAQNPADLMAQLFKLP